jgi:RNA polymerase sigma-70 factor (ECF subfamily)
MRIAREDDEKAFGELYRLYYDRLFRFAMHLVRREEGSEEIVSDVFFHVWQNRQALTRIEDLDAYLFRAVKNGALNYLDREKRDLPCDELSVTVEYVPDADDPEQVLLQEELNRVLQNAIESLPEKCRIIFKLVREDGFKYKQIAEMLDLSVRTIDAQMAIAVRKIKEAVKKYFDE